jgi:hypothetical protein
MNSTTPIMSFTNIDVIPIHSWMNGKHKQELIQ